MRTTFTLFFEEWWPWSPSKHKTFGHSQLGGFGGYGGYAGYGEVGVSTLLLADIII